MHNLTVETFADHLNDHFAINHGAGRVDLSLVEATPRGTGRPDGRQPFVLLFHGPLTPVLPQAIYSLEHPAFSSLEIFIVPVGPEGEAMRYEAIFA